MSDDWDDGDRPDRRGNGASDINVSAYARHIEARLDVDANGVEIEETDGTAKLIAWRMPKPPQHPPPRRYRTGSLDVERRAYVELLWRSLYSSGEIEEIVTGRFPCSVRTVQNDIRAVRERYAKEETDPLVVRTRKARMRALLEGLYQHALAADDCNTARFVADKLAKLDGLYAPVKVEHTANPTALTLDAIIDALGDDPDALAAFELVVSKLDARGVKPVEDVAQLEAGAIDAESEER